MFLSSGCRAALLATLSLLSLPMLAQEMEHHHIRADDERLGTVDFPISCAGSQAAFTRGVALLHSFWYEEAEKAFRAIATKDRAYEAALERLTTRFPDDDEASIF
jgi:hypothetical protein